MTDQGAGLFTPLRQIASVVLAPSALMHSVAQVDASHPSVISAGTAVLGAVFAVTTSAAGDQVPHTASTVGDPTLLVEHLLFGLALGVAVLVTAGRAV